jgi:hypothetical protein
LTTLLQILVYAAAIGYFVVVLVLVRRGVLRDRLAVVWIIVGIAMLAIALARPLLDRLSVALGISDGTTTVFLLAIAGLLAVQLQLSVMVTRLEDRTRELAEAFALQYGVLAAEPGTPIEEGDHGSHDGEPAAEKPVHEG